MSSRFLEMSKRNDNMLISMNQHGIRQVIISTALRFIVLTI